MARQPSRLSVVSSALSSASDDDGEAPATTRRKPTINYNENDDEDDEDELSDALSDISEDEVDDEEDDSGDTAGSSNARTQVKKAPPTSAPAPASAAPKKTASLKVTLGGVNRSKGKQPAAATSGPSTSSKVSNNRGTRTVQSDDEDDEDEEENDTPNVQDEESDDELDELGDMQDDETLPPAADLADDDDEDDEAFDSDGEPIFKRHANTPKTARQLARAAAAASSSSDNNISSSDLLQLPMSDDSRKLKRTEAELALKRSETARRRRYQSEKKLDDEKTETINRLLKKQVGRKSNRQAAADRSDDEDDDEDEDQDEDERQERKRARIEAGGGSGSGGSGLGPMSRKEKKDLPKPFFRVVIGPQSTTVSVPLSQQDYVAKWQKTFPGASDKTVGAGAGAGEAPSS